MSNNTGSVEEIHSSWRTRLLALSLALCGGIASAQEACYPWTATVSSGNYDLKGFSVDEVCQALVARRTPALINGGQHRLTLTYTGATPSTPGGSGYFCNVNRVAVDVETGALYAPDSGPWSYDGVVPQCGPVPTNDASCPIANPTQPGIGVKVERSTDYQGAGSHPLILERSYRSQVQAALAYGVTDPWRHSHSARLDMVLDVSGAPMRLYARRAGGENLIFSHTGNGTWQAYSATRDLLTELRDAQGVRTGFTYQVFADDSSETYDAAGRLLGIRARNGWLTTLEYSTASTPASIAPVPGLLVSVKNHFGRELRFTHDAQGRLAELLPPGAVSGSGAGAATSLIRYAYAEPASLGTGVAAQNQLSSVTWQDGALRRYHYEDARWPGALTGITDEAGVRYATYAYDAQGRVSRSEHAGGVDRVDFSYFSGFDGGVWKTTTTVTDYAGANGSATSRTYTFKDVGNTRYPASVTAPCPLCGSTQQSSQYNAAGDPVKTIGHDGTVTFHAYDAKGRQTERATFPASEQAASTRPPLSRATQVVSTKWHGSFNLPTQVAEPGKVTVYTYNAKGMLTGESWTATTDVTGAAKFSAVKTGSTYATGWGYNASSLNTSIVEKTGGVETQRWTLAYSAAGDLTRITDVTGGNLVGRATAYDAHGRILAGTTDAGIAIRRSYSPRGFVASSAVDSQTSTYTQNAIGLTTQVQMPDGQALQYVYDAAHKLTDVRLNGASITPAMLASAEYPDTLLESLVARSKASVVRVIEGLVSPAHAQTTGRLLQRIIPIPGTPMPGQPEYDPRSDLLRMAPMSVFDRAALKAAETFARSCECKPEGGYDRPTFTYVSYAHVLFSGHLSPRFSDKSYFAPTEKVGQALVDEVLANATHPPELISGRMVVRATLERSLDFVGYARGLDGAFRPTNRVRLVYEPSNCSDRFRAANEVVTLYPE